MPIPLLTLAISAFSIGHTVGGKLADAARQLASTLNIGAFNLGNAAGAWLGGLVTKRGYALDLLPWVAATVTAVALAVTWLAARMDIPSAAPHRG